MGAATSVRCYNCACVKMAVKTFQGVETCTRCGAPKDGSYSLEGESKAGRPAQAPVHRIHVVAVRETLPEPMTEAALIQNYLGPHLPQLVGRFVSAGDTLNIQGVEFQIKTVVPAPGFVGATTSFRSMDPPVSRTQRCRQLHALPLAASLPSGRIDEAVFFREHLKPHVVRHPQATVGDTFVSNGVQLRIVAAEPNGSTVDGATDLFPGGQPIPDLKRVTIAAVYESLSDRDRALTPEQMAEQYLEPFFNGRFKYLSLGQEVKIESVLFKVIACDPVAGVVTNKTAVDNRGMAFAESRGQRQAGPVDFDARFQAILERLPLDDPRRALVLRLQARIAMIPMLAHSAEQSDLILGNTLAFLQAAAPQPDERGVGCSPAEIECLPTRKWTVKNNAELKDQEQAMCMVCLDEYALDDELRTLPCFHSYHKKCIDPWLSRSRACPLCKHVVST